MVSFKFAKSKVGGRVSNASGGIAPSSLPGNSSGNTLNKDGGIVSRHVQEAGGRTKAATGTYAQSAIKVSDRYAANGDTDMKAPKGGGARGNPEKSRTRGKAMPNSGGAALKVAASGIGLPGGMGGTHNKAQPNGEDTKPQVFSQKNKNLTMSKTAGKPMAASRGGFSGSFQPGAAKGATGHSGSGLGKKKRTSFY